MPKPVTVRAQALDGTWETIGADRAAGIWVEQPTFESDWWGPSKASFTLKRDGRRAFPDLSTYAPIDALVGEKPVWAGRTSETPHGGSNLSTSVQCDGAQFHLDDDMFEKFYVHSRLGDWKDSRTLPNASLTAMPARMSVTTGAGTTLVGCPAGTSWPSGASIGITIDMGPAAAIRAATLNFSRVGTGSLGSNIRVYIRLSNSDNADVVGTDIFIAASLGIYSTGPNTVFGSNATGARYAHIFVFNPGVTTTPSVDEFLRINSVTVYAETSYQAGGTGTALLKASDVIVDALTNGTSQLSSDTTLVAATATNLHDFYVQGPKTPREYITNANAFHNYKTAVDASRRMVFAPRPTSPVYEIGEWSGASIDDLSANAGDAIYDRVIVQATDPAGQPVRVTRNAAFAVATTRRGFHRTKTLDVGFALPSDGVLAAAIGDAWLGQNYLTSMKGTIKVKEGDVRNVLTGQSIPLEDLLGSSHQLVRLMDRHDPDTGGWGRDARIAGAKWNPVTDEAEITLDNTRSNFEALLARLAVVGAS